MIYNDEFIWVDLSGEQSKISAPKTTTNFFIDFDRVQVKKTKSFKRFYVDNAALLSTTILGQKS